MSGSEHMRVTRIKETEANVRETDDGQFERTEGVVSIYTSDGSRFDFPSGRAPLTAVGRILPTYVIYDGLSRRRAHPINAPDGRGPQ